jgi:hypothetical protein
LSSIQSRLIKIGARVVCHARKITFQLAEVAVRGTLFGQIIAAIRKIDDFVADTAVSVESAHKNGQAPHNTKLLGKYRMKKVAGA